MAPDPTAATDAVERSLAAVGRWEPAVHAWAHLDAERARAEARSRVDGPLVGLVVGVKDVFDTADQPTAYGSSIYDGHRSSQDAAAVATLRGAGATVLGKTVTAEFACYAPGPTTNPHRATHTPGGSSSGSAAAVATAMVDVALGTQTAGSVIRPASYCGVLGFKPTYARAPTTGVKVVAPSLDTVGWFARDVGVLDRVRVALTGSPATAPLGRAPRLAVVRTGHWHDADPDARAALDHAAHLAVAAGAAVGDAMLSPACERLAADQPVVMAYEAARSLAWEHRTHPELLSASLRALLERGLATEPLDYRRVLAQAAVERARADEIFGGADAVLTLAATGEAPAGLGSTGDPRFARLWTLLGLPTVSLPGLTGRSGLPVGVQLVGRHDDDATLLAIAAWLGAALPTPARPTAPAARGYS